MAIAELAPILLSPASFAVEDDGIIQRNMLNRSANYGEPICRLSPCRKCGSDWKYEIGAHCGGMVWRCLSCGAVGHTR